MAVSFLRVQLLGLVGLVVASAIGGIAFHFLESDNEDLQRNTAAVQLGNFLATHPCVNLTLLQEMSELLQLAKLGGIRIAPPTQSNPILENFTNWDIQNTVFLSFQAVGSIGFGNINPNTTNGRVFMVFFILCGIPLFFATAYGVGEVLASRSNQVREAVYRRILHREAPNKVTTVARFYNTLGLFLFGFPLFVIVPSVVFYSLENWTYGESLYSTILATLTIGFTDFQPGVAAPASYRGVYRILVGIWLIVDLFWFGGVLYSIKGLLKMQEKIKKPLDEAIREERSTGKDGQRKIKVKKNWKKKHFDQHFTQPNVLSPGVVSAVSHVDVVPVYISAQLYPAAINSVTDSRLTVLTPISSSGNVSRLIVGAH